MYVVLAAMAAHTNVMRFRVEAWEEIAPAQQFVVPENDAV